MTYFFSALALAIVTGVAHQPPTSPPPPAPSFAEQMQAEIDKLGDVLRRGTDLQVAGDAKAATKLILDVFPDASRTPIQALVLGNILFHLEPELSYDLHKQAVKTLSDQRNALLEWALEQHRAREYAAAAKTYAQYSAIDPDFALALGLAAECLLRSGDEPGAIASWQKSEAAQNGSIEDFESMVCEVHTFTVAERRRDQLLPPARSGDLAAIQDLIALDCAWPTDWWNNGPREMFLKPDLEMVRALKLDSSPELNAALCAGELALADGRGANKLLRKYNMLIGSESTIPRNGQLLSVMLDAALNAKLFGNAASRDKLGDRILAVAKETKDAEAYNCVAHLFLNTERLADIDLAAWEATGDPRFAASWLAGAMRQKTLTLASPEMVRSLAQFPENSVVARIALELARQEGKPLRPYLVSAIKAEYTRFSPDGDGTLYMTRPRADALRKYFAELATLPAPAAPTPQPKSP